VFTISLFSFQRLLSISSCSTHGGGGKMNAYRILVTKPEGKWQLGRLRSKQDHDIKTYVREAERGGMDWIDLAQDRNQRKTVAGFCKMLGNSWVAAQLAASQEELSCMELVLISSALLWLQTAWFSTSTYARRRDSSVGIATGYGLGDGGASVRVPVGSRIFLSPCRPDRLWGQASLLSNGYRGLFSPGVKRPGREADHSPLAIVEVKKTRIYTSAPPYIFMA
jgi:hypothetical protein